MAKYRFTGKTFIRLLTTIPFIMPTVVTAAGFNALLCPKGWLNIMLQTIFSLDQPPIHIINTLGAILLAHVFYNSTVFIRIVGGAWSQLDPKVEYAARTLGASPLRVWQKITIPLLKPALLSAILLVFLFNFTSFAVILLLGGPKFSTLEVEIYIQALHMLNLPIAGLLSAIQLIFTLMLTIFYTRLIKTKSVALTPRDPDEIVKPISGWKQRTFLITTLSYLIMLFVLPLLSLILRSFLLTNNSRNGNGIISNQFSLVYYQELFLNRRIAVLCASYRCNLQLTILWSCNRRNRLILGFFSCEDNLIPLTLGKNSGSYFDASFGNLLSYFRPGIHPAL